MQGEPRHAAKYPFSVAVPLRAGVKTPIRIEYAKTAAGYLHLVWESRSQEVEYVPVSALYP
jgi:hypothetical protein